MGWLREHIEGDKKRAEGMEHRTNPEDPYYSCPGSRTEPLGDLEWGEDACDCFLAERKAEALAKADAALAILDEHAEGWQIGDPLRDCQWEVWPCKTLRLVASGYRHRPGYAEHWGNGQ